MIFGHIFCKDHIDIHQQIYGTLDLSLYRSYSQSLFFSTFFQKSYHTKTIVPSETKCWVFFPENHNFHISQLCCLKICFSCNWIIWEHNACHYLLKYWKNISPPLSEIPKNRPKVKWCRWTLMFRLRSFGTKPYYAGVVVCVAILHMPPYWSGDCSSSWVQAHP